jgi:hypothetical protein
MTGWLDFLMRIEDRSGGAASAFAMLIHFISQHLAEFLDPPTVHSGLEFPLSVT